jgi:DNA-binding NtrC family response regulator
MVSTTKSQSEVRPLRDGALLPAESSLRHELQALEVFARALLNRIVSLRNTAEQKVSVNIAAEVQHFEAELILAALVETGGRQRCAARLLGMNITTLNRRLKQYHIKLDHIGNGNGHQSDNMEVDLR